MRAKIYHFLVNRKPGIRQRYHKYHDGATGGRKVLSWIYLLGINLLYFILSFSWEADRDSSLRGKETAVRRE